MQLSIPPKPIAHAGLRALKTIALVDSAAHTLQPLEERLLAAVQQHILHSSFELDALTVITPQELAKSVADPALRERILLAGIVMALIDGVASPAEGQLLAQFAAALELHSDALADVQRIIAGRLWTARIDIARRSFIGQRARSYHALEGIRGFGRTLCALFDIENPTLAARYAALERLPHGTLGREYYEFVRRNRLALPGEAHAGPEGIVFHDCLHVLAEYETTSLEETQVASFQAGMLKRDAVYGLLFMLAQFQLGLQVTPITGPEKLVADPELMLAAFVRGTHVTCDLCVDWVPQQDFERTLDELRVEYNIQPRQVAHV